MVSLLIASPYPAMRAGLRVLLEEANLKIAGEADTLQACEACLASTRPHLILFDLALDDEALSGLWRLHTHFPAVPLLALTDMAGGAPVLAALQAGARGCLPKTATGAELADAARNAAAGVAVLPPAAAEALLAELRGEAASRPAVESLTARELEVLRGVAAGQTNKAMALKLGISEHTVKFHLGTVMSKLGAASRAEAVALAMQRGLLAL